VSSRWYCWALAGLGLRWLRVRTSHAGKQAAAAAAAADFSDFLFVICTARSILVCSSHPRERNLPANKPSPILDRPVLSWELSLHCFHSSSPPPPLSVPRTRTAQWRYRLRSPKQGKGQRGKTKKIEDMCFAARSGPYLREWGSSSLTCCNRRQGEKLTTCRRRPDQVRLRCQRDLAIVSQPSVSSLFERSQGGEGAYDRFRYSFICI
jgi:hypothetical protein